MERNYFKEEQKFDQWWLRVIFILTWISTVGIFGWGVFQQLILKKPWGDNPTSDTVLVLTAIFIFLLMTGVTWLIFSMRLITEVTENGFRYRFPPVINKVKIVPKSMIAEYQIRKYSPVGEYGGWGIKGAGMGRGRAYNVKGNMGLQLRLQNNKKILFGTQRPEALKAAMDKIMNPPGY
jgi:hypothetical protein